ncbi:MAG: diguanylate cyclase [Planctomycetales bacterium]|nr:diguanylate cyclase [Planctomycetales bacterium]
MSSESHNVRPSRIVPPHDPSQSSDAHLNSLTSLLDGLDDHGIAKPDSSRQRALNFENHLVQVRLGVASSLFAALRARHAPTAAHSLRVSVACSAWLSHLGLPESERDTIEVAALLHDIGKIGVPDAVLKKPAALTREEQLLMVRHRRMGIEILRHASVSPDLLNIIKYSTAWYDGSHANADRQRDELPLGSRLLAIVDAFDAMTTDQIYRPAMSRDRAVAELYRCAGTQFSPELVEHFCRLVMSDAVDLNAAVEARWLKQLQANRSDQMWRLQMSDSSEFSSANELFHEKLLQSMHDGVVFIDAGGSILYWNRACERLTGIPSTAVADKQWDPSLVGLCDESGSHIARDECPLIEVLKSRTQLLRRMSLQGRGSVTRLIDAHFVPVVGRDGSVHGAALVMHDATSEASLEERVQSLHERATQDPLTKVANRAEFDRTIEQYVASHMEQNRRCSLIICDIDYFKRINDQYGHQAGDEALVSFAALLRRFCRAGDLVARYGGEEFVMLCANCDNATATARADEIRVDLSETPQSMLNGKCITASFGVTEMQPGDTPETMLRRADRGLLQAKETGRNRVVQLGPGMENDEKSEGGRGWFSWFDSQPLEHVAEQTLITRVPFDVAIEKLRGFIADHEGELTSVQEKSLAIKIEGDNTPLRRRRSDRAVPFMVELEFEGDDNASSSGLTQTRIHVVIRPLRSRDRRKGDIEERARLVLSSLKSYLMATECSAKRPAKSK